MALLLHDLTCASCGQRHNFGLEGDRWQAGVPYEYVCPQTAQRAAMCVPGTALIEGAPHWPQGAVRLTKASPEPIAAGRAEQ